MARIRSVHPGLFTDEAFVTLSPMARVLFIGIWCEADDGGVFEWKPISLKMRILPADNADMPALMGELAAANVVKQYAAEGREYGAIRNFCRYQRPKKPKTVHPMPPEFRTYVGSDARSSEPDDDEGGSSSPPKQHEARQVPPKPEPRLDKPRPVPKKSENPIQMEDGGGSRKREIKPASAVVEPADLESRCRRAVGEEPACVSTDFGVILRLLEEPNITEVDVMAGIAAGLAKADPGFRFVHWRNFDGWIRGAAKDRLGGTPRNGSSPPGEPEIDVRGVKVPRSRVQAKVDHYRETGEWPDELRERWGPPPGERGSYIPPSMLEAVH